jgi:vacuolar-type H+-ATPase subunit D/Vma8
LKSERRYTRIDEVCRTHKTAVEEEVKNILGIEDPEISAQAYFEQRTAAAKNVYETMNEVEKKKVNDDVERGKMAPNEPAIQQRWVQPNYA